MHMTYCNLRSGPGWQVRSGKPGPGQTRFFADRKHGGTEAARAAAESLMEKARPFAPPPKPRPARPENETHVPGIRVRLRRHAAHGAVYRFLAVSYVDQRGRPRCTSISLEAHGIADAIERALELRGLQGHARDEARAAVLQVCRNGSQR